MIRILAEQSYCELKAFAVKYCQLISRNRWQFEETKWLKTVFVWNFWTGQEQLEWKERERKFRLSKDWNEVNRKREREKRNTLKERILKYWKNKQKTTLNSYTKERKIQIERKEKEKEKRKRKRRRKSIGSWAFILVTTPVHFSHVDSQSKKDLVVSS